MLGWQRVEIIYVHYTAAASDETGDPRARMRGVQNYHMDTKGWCDFAYNWAFSRSGLKLQGRGWGVKSAATGTENGKSQAIVFLGADAAGRDDVSPAGRDALGELIHEAFKLKGREIFVKGHTEAPNPAGSTECPGKELLAYIHAKGWKDPKPPVFRYPRNFYIWAAWYLGEGEFAEHGRRYMPLRPNVPKLLTPAYWTALKHYLKTRQTKHA